MTDFQELVREFQDVFQQEPDVELQFKLIREEFLELQDELQEDDVDPYCVAKELGDLLYVTFGLANFLRIDAERVVQDIHTSNMSKLDDDGDPIFREDGKILKSENYMPPTFNRAWFK